MAHEALRRAAPEPSAAQCLNFADRPTDARTWFDAPTFRRLGTVRQKVDPQGVHRANHPIPPADAH